MGNNKEFFFLRVGKHGNGLGASDTSFKIHVFYIVWISDPNYVMLLYG
jgi:hypothetical protein